MNRPHGIAPLALALLLFSHGAHAQVPVPAPPPPPGERVALIGATVHTMAGASLEDGVLIWRDGLLESVGGAGTALPPGCEVIDLEGLHVYPGLISTETVLGLSEIGSVRQTSDHTDVGKYNPHLRAEVALNPDSELLPVTRAGGVLSALVVPRGGRISGRSALIRLDGWTWEELTVAAPVGMHIRWPGQGLGDSRGDKRDEQREENAAQVTELSEFFANARAYAKAKRAAGDPDLPLSARDVKWEAMRPVLSGELPLFVHANEVRQIRSALDWTEEQGLRMILVGGRDAPLVAGRLLEREVPVIVGGTLRVPARDWEPYDHAFTLPARLHAAGVRFCISSGGGAAHEFRLPWHAAMAMSYGLPEEEALRAITRYPAEILGQGERLGSLVAGREATLIVTDGSPMDIRTNVLRAFIRGREIELTSRHTRLYEKYRQRPKDR